MYVVGSAHQEETLLCRWLAAAATRCLWRSPPKTAHLLVLQLLGQLPLLLVRDLLSDRHNLQQ